MKNIILIGMPGSGKTTLGRAAADHLGRQFFDADECLEKWEKRSVEDFFAESETAFRAAETRTLKKLAEKEGSIIAAGGGAVIREENMTVLRKTGIICFIDRKPEEIAKDIDIEVRPLLAEGKQRLHRIYEERINLYRKYGEKRIRNRGTWENTLQELLEIIGGIK